MKKDKKDLRIVFLGTPEFAVESLDRLVKGGYNVVGVITMPDKTGGRGNKVIQSAVKQYAVAHGLPLLQPVSLKNEMFIEQLRALKADLQIVIAFRMLPKVVWEMPPLGTFNLHASLLPKYRGAAPINRAVMNGETETGVTTFLLKHEIDTGDVLQQVRIPIALTDNVETVHDRLMMLGADLVIETVEGFLNGTIKPIPQDKMLTAGVEPTPAPKIFKEDCHIDWTKPSIDIYNLIRGLSPYPAAWSTFVDGAQKQIQFKVYETSLPSDDKVDQEAGSIIATKHALRIVCGDGKTLEIKQVQLAGKKRMSADELMRGFKMTSIKAC